MAVKDRSNVSSGELSGKLLGRNDLDAFKRGVKRMRDGLPLTGGGFMNRYGFEAVMPTRRNDVGYFYEFSFALTDSVAIGFFPGWIRFYDNDGVILDTDASWAATNTETVAGEAVVTLAAEASYPTTDDDVYFEGTGIKALDGQFFRVTAVDTGTRKITIRDCFNNVVTVPTSSGLTGTVLVVFEIPNPYPTVARYENLSTAQKGEVIAFCNGYDPMYEITRVSAYDWTITRTTLTGTIFQDAISAVSKANPAVVTTSAVHGFGTGDAVFLDDIGGMTELNGRWFTITRINTTQFSLGVDSSGYTTYTSGGAAFNSYKQPTTVGYYGGRRFLGGPGVKPDWFYGSKLPTDAGETQYNDFTTGSNPKDGIAFNVTSVSGTKDTILFFAGTNKFLAIGSTGGTYKVDGGTDGAPIAVGAIRSLPVDSTPAAAVEPVNTGTSTQYVRTGGEALQSLEYDLFADGFTAIDMTLLSDVAAASGIKRLVHVSDASEITFALREDGAFAVLSRKGREEIAGWSTLHAAGTNAKILSACGMRETDGRDTMWACTERTVDGQTRRMVERMVRDPRGVDYPYTGDELADRHAYEKLLKEKVSRMVRLDSCLVYDGAQATTLTISGATAVAGAAVFTSADVGQRVRVRYATGYESGVAVIAAVVNPTTVTLEIHQPFDKAAYASGAWYLGVSSVYVPHLEGETVSYIGDGGEGTEAVVTDGVAVLDGSYGRVVLGLAYDSFMELTPALATDTYGNAEPGEQTRILTAALRIYETQAVWAGPTPYAVQQVTLPRAKQQVFVSPVPLTTIVKAPALSGFSADTCYTIMARKGLPCTVLAVTMTTE